MSPAARAALVALAIAGAAILIRDDRPGKTGKRDHASVAATRPVEPKASSATSPAGKVPVDADIQPEEPDANGSPLARELNAPGGTPRRDVETLHELVLQYQRLMRHPNAPPIGGDADLVRAMTGHNPLGLVILPPGHRAISADGRLRDRWGTPYFVHPTGGGAIEIRSAGPDKKTFTADDVTAE